jgi:hypothetical protein
MLGVPSLPSLNDFNAALRGLGFARSSRCLGLRGPDALGSGPGASLTELVADELTSVLEEGSVVGTLLPDFDSRDFPDEPGFNGADGIWLAGRLLLEPCTLAKGNAVFGPVLFSSPSSIVSS